jgi:cleavage and polyadenylation specificity factor subunit 1
VSFAEPYILLIRDDMSLIILRSDHTGELEEVEISSALSSGKWISGSLFDDSNDVFRLDAEEEEQDEDGGSILIFLLNDEGGLKVGLNTFAKSPFPRRTKLTFDQIFRASNFSRPAYHASGLSLLPPYLSEDFVARRLAAKAELVEILVVEIGDYISRSPVLMVSFVCFDRKIGYHLLHTWRQCQIPSSISTNWM